LRYFLNRPADSRNAILLVESGSRGLLEKIVPSLRQTWGSGRPHRPGHLLFQPPARLSPETHARPIASADYRGRHGRHRLTGNSPGTAIPCLGIVCSEEPVMTKWKWVLALRIPAKVFIVNENGDYFWFDRQHLGVIRHFVALRLRPGGRGSRSHAGAPVFVSVQFGLICLL